MPYDAAKEHVALRILHERLHRTLRHHAEVGVVVENVLVGGLHYAVERLCRDALEPCVGLALLSHAIHDVAAVVLDLTRHAHDGCLIVLKVSIYRHHGVAQRQGLFHACPQRVLMAHVVGELQPRHLLVGFGRLADELPCAVAAAVVDKQQAGVGVGFGFQPSGEGEELVERPRKNLFLVVAGHDDV